MARAARGPTITGPKGSGFKGNSLKAIAARAGIAEYLRILNEREKDFSPAWGGIIAEFHRQEQQVFMREGAIGGHPQWKPLSPRYHRWKERHRPGVPILYLGARGPYQSLANALTDPTTGGCKYKWGRFHLLIQTDVPVDGHDLGGLHMTGAPDRQTVTGARNPLPAREPIRLSMAEVWRMVGHALNWFLEGKSSTRAMYT